jgi:alpha-1,2-mannosyltransferase
MALVAFNGLAARRAWPRGALIGLAAAVKLTSAAFVLYFLLRRYYRAAGTSAPSFATLTGAGFLLDRQQPASGSQPQSARKESANG